MKIIVLLFSLIGFVNFVQAQCVPAAADVCKDANVLCSLDELNGYSCTNPDYSNPTGCTPLCSSGGGAHNTNWWAFVTKGGNVCITITFSNCSVNGTGVQFGLWGDCSCTESIFCDPSCTGPGSKMACGILTACKTYYLFVDGCTSDVCDFKINTDGGSPPKLPSLGNIKGPSILCKGACNVKYSVDLGNTNCKPDFQWTLDGVEFNQFGSEFTYDFQKEGNFILCVTASIGNVFSGSVCDQKGPKCIQVTVGKNSIRKDSPRVVCIENLPIDWHGQMVTGTGNYKVHFKDSFCCEYDSIVSFVAIKKSNKGTVFFLACPGESYIDTNTRDTINQCVNPFQISFPNDLNSNICDSSYNLYAAFMNATGILREYCQGGSVYLEVTPVDKTCPVNGYVTNSFEYKWYDKFNPNKTLGSDEFIEVKCEEGTYCVDLTMEGKLGNQIKKCTFTICDNFNESYYCSSICPFGEQQLCVGSVGTYSVNALFPADAKHIWTVNGGKIQTQNTEGKKSIDILWNFDPFPNKYYEGIICYHMESSCPNSPECCFKVKVIADPSSVNAGKDDEIKGLKYALNAQPNIKGNWSFIKGPGKAIFKNNTDPATTVSVSQYGKYSFRWNVKCANTDYSDTVQINFVRFIRSGGKINAPGTDSCCVDNGNFSTIKERSHSSYSVFPNPVHSDHIQITGGSKGTTSNLFLYNLQGTKVLEHKLDWNDATLELDIPNILGSGIYYLRIQDIDGNYWMEKLVIFK